MYKLLTIYLLLISQNILANKIDSLKTDCEVEAFLQTFNKDSLNIYNQAPKILTTDSLRRRLSCSGIFNKWKIKNWEKADFNNDGKSDIIITAFWYQFQVFVVIDQGNNTFKLIQVSKNIFEDCELAKPLKLGKQTLLLFYQKKHEYINDNKTALKVRDVDQIDTLIYKFNDFVERNKRPANYQINSVLFSTSSCLGNCPVYTLTIDYNRNVIYEAISHNSKQGNFTSVISDSTYQQLILLINYLSIKKLANYYVVDWTDDQTAYLKVKFKDGTVKEIRDYGLIGTWGLNRLYKMFAQIKDTQTWK